MKERLNSYYEAEIAILTSQSYTIGSRTLTRANLAEVRNAIRELEAEIRKLESGTRRAKRVIPVDL